jgi:hypothetical protein
MMVIYLIYWHLSSEQLGMSTLKEGAVVAFGEWSPQERPKHKKTIRAGTLRKE